VQNDVAMANKMVEQAVAECAEEHFAGDIRRMRQAVLHGQCEHCHCITEHLVKQISEYLGQVDNTVKAVYRYEPMDLSSASQSEGMDRSREYNDINLVVWVNRKSAALAALTEMWESALQTNLHQLGCVLASPACFTLNVTMVDDRDIDERRGLGLLVNNPSLRSTLVWKRLTQAEKVSPKEMKPAQVKFALPESFDLELMPESRLLEHASTIENTPPEERKALEHHLTELKVTLIRRLISDQLNYINIAKRWFTIADLADIFRHRIGFGTIGGKSAGMLLAARILNEIAEPNLKACVHIPESYFLGSDLMYVFMVMNGLMHWNDQKYKSEDQIRADYPQVYEEIQAGEFPPEVLTELKVILNKIGPHPIIVRSSSQLEDNFGTSFAGKYDSHFCPNQGTPEENLKALTNAIARTYASTFKPDALLYRRSRGLQDYDERMSILIQTVQGEQCGRYFFPFGAGVALSHNIYRWAPKIRREDGFARLVWGLGTRAVERVGNDYPHLVALSHPTLQPNDSPEAIRYYSQQYVDVIDLEENIFKTLPAHDVLNSSYQSLRLLAQIEQDGYLITPYGRVMESDIPRLVITFDSLLKRTAFPSLLSGMLHLLEEHFHSAVDVEFTVHVVDPDAVKPEIRISLLQCRPQSSLLVSQPVHSPKDLAREDIIFSSHFIMPQGYLPEIRHVIFIPAENYFALPSVAARNGLSRIVARLNSALGKKTFICVGPGRWGATNTDLGVFVGYADICNAGALVELAGKEVGPAPEPSLGTHFFQDLMEAQIYPVAVPLDDEETIFNREFFYDTPSCLRNWVDVDSDLADCVRVIDVASYRPGYHLVLVMDDEKGQAVAYLVPD
jgi:hypothetical protein